MITREEAVRAFNAAKAAKRAAKEAARPKATVLEFPVEEQERRAIVDGRHGRWVVEPFSTTSYVVDRGPTEAEWEMVQSCPKSSDPHERYSRSLYGDTK